MNTFILSIFFGIIGTAYFVYGKKRPHTGALIAGILLCVFPYFVSNFYVSLIIGIILIVLPFKVDL